MKNWNARLLSVGFALALTANPAGLIAMSRGHATLATVFGVLAILGPLAILVALRGWPIEIEVDGPDPAP